MGASATDFQRIASDSPRIKRAKSGQLLSRGYGMHKRHTKVTRSQEQEVRDMLERRKEVLAISRGTGISRSKIYEVKRELGTPRKSPQELAKEWFETLPNREASVSSVRIYIHQVEAATGMGAWEHRLSYGPAEEMERDLRTPAADHAPFLRFGLHGGRNAGPGPIGSTLREPS